MERIKAQFTQLKQFEGQRKGWLVLSAFIAAIVAGIIFDWDSLVNNHAMWVVASLGLLLSMVWWYWSMRLIRFVLQYKIEETIILNDIITEIRDIKKSVLEDLTKDK